MARKTKFGPQIKDENGSGIFPVVPRTFDESYTCTQYEEVECNAGGCGWQWEAVSDQTVVLDRTSPVLLPDYANEAIR